MTEPGYVTPAAPGWWVKKNIVMFPTPATLTLTGGTPATLTPILTAPAGGSLTLTGGTPTTSTAPAIAFKSANSATGASIAMPTHAAGDLLLMFAFRSTSSGAAALAAGWTDIINGGANLVACRVAYKIAASSSEVSGTWTGADELLITVYSNVSGIGAAARNDVVTSTTLAVPSMTLDITTRKTSWVVIFGGTNQIAGTFPANTANGYALRHSFETGGDDMGAYDTGPVSSWPSDTISYGTSTNGECAAVELLQ